MAEQVANVRKNEKVGEVTSTKMAKTIVVVSERAFGFDLRETIINGWEG